ncbi:hypothetical protein AC249_AIPGENE1192 [Exaiptasia diaphana]|nr:hypothetical protein AC249_AIPGENE1192 [Exaiptasia diaphana]
MYSREEQLEILQRLQPLWTIRFQDELLNEVTHPSHVNEDEVFVQTVNQGEASTSTDTVTKGNQLEKSPVKDHRQHELEKKYIDLKKEIKNFMNLNIKQSKYNECDNVMSTLLDILCSYKSMATDVEIDDQERWLCTVSQWVGREFKKHKNTIESNATEFKKKHIAAINKLPPAEALIREIFPTSMIVLLKTWMDIEAMKTESEKWLPFPLMQLILEFANQTLYNIPSRVLLAPILQVQMDYCCFIGQILI